LIIGSIKLTYDSTNNALKVQKTDGTAANLYALGSVSALGFGGGPRSTSISQLTLTGRLKIGQSGEHQIYGDSNGILVIDGADGIRLDNNISLNGYTLSADGGAIELNGGQLYLDNNNTKYIYVSGTHLYFYNGSTIITLA
jgi:hypothetical protein